MRNNSYVIYYVYHASYCQEHAWKTQKFNPGKFSIFTVDEDEDLEPAYNQLELEPDIEASVEEGLQKALRKTQSNKLGRPFAICGGNAGPL